MSYFIGVAGDPRQFRIFSAIFGVLVAVVLLFGSIGTVRAGERGIKVRFGAVVATLPEGLYFKVPFIEKVIRADVKIQKDEVDASAASKDLQTVTAKVAVNYHLDPTRVAEIYREIGIDYNARLIAPTLQESVKAATARFTADELITKRSEVRDAAKVALTEKLSPRGIAVDDFNIVNFDFSPSFNKAIEEKVTAEQNALAAKNKLEQSKYEAEQRIAQAKGEAEAIRIQVQAIQNQGGEEYVELKRIEKWNGAYPTTMLGSATPLLNLK